MLWLRIQMAAAASADLYCCGAELAVATSVALHLDELLAHAVGECHPRAADKRLPIASGWIGVAAKTLALLRSGGSFLGRLREPLVRQVQKCVLSDEKFQDRAVKR